MVNGAMYKVGATHSMRGEGGTMAVKVRKQVHIEPRQEAILERLARLHER